MFVVFCYTTYMYISFANTQLFKYVDASKLSGCQGNKCLLNK